MLDKDYPNLFQAADAASKASQNSYLCLMKVDLLSAIAGAALAIYNSQRDEYIICIYIVSALFLFTAFVCSIILLKEKHEDGWYQGRAMAESCKTLTWRYIMQSEYFEKSELNESTQIKPRFIGRLFEIQNEYQDFTKKLNSKILKLPPITSEMIRIRSSNLDDRKGYYITNRIDNQIDWYSSKERYNNRYYYIWFAVILVAQFLTLGCAIFLIIEPHCQWNFVGLFSTIGASAISWLQLKQHQELKQAYTTAVIELNKIKALSDNILHETDFSKFVLDAENAISREHTLWVAQRRK